MEHRMRCKVCGKIWCFTDQDLKKNSSNSLMSGIAAIGGIASVLGGTTAQQHLNYDIMERNQAKVVDYYQCPNCRSKDVVELSEEEWEEVQTQESFANARVSVNANATTEALLTRIKLLLEDKDWPNANAYCDAVLDAEPESAMAYVYKLMAELRVSKQADLANHKVPFDTKPNYQKAVRFADDSLRQMLNGYIAHINERNERERLDGLYNNACAAMQQSATEEAYKNAASLFAVIKGHKDADNLQAECLRKAEQARLEAERKATEEKAAAAEQAKKMKKIAMIVVPIVVAAIVAAVIISGNMQKSTAYNAAVALAEAGQYDEAVAAFTELGNYKDSAEQINEITYNQAVALLESGNYDEAISTFTDLGNYKDSAEQAANAGLEKEYVYAIALLEKGQEYHEEARKIFEMVGGYKDANKYFNSFVVRMTSEQSDDTVCTYIYNENGEISRMNCNNAAAVEYDYNEAGDLIRMGNTTYTYSPDKRTVTQTSKGSVYLDNYTIVNEYNEQGLLISSTRSGSDAGTTTCTYELNRDGTVAQKAEIRTQLPGGYEAVTTYEYGSNGLVSKEIKSTTYNYDQNHGHSPSSVQTLDYSYDSDGRLILAESNHTSYTYSQWSTDVKESTYHYTHQYTYGWVYAPNAKE